MLQSLGDMVKKGLPFVGILHGFLRVVAVLAIISGLLQWARIIGFSTWQGLHFLEMPLEWQCVVVFFGVLDLVAGIGLWLLANWGTVIWLFLSLSKVVMHTAFASTFGRAPLENVFYICAIAIYLILLYFSEREGRH
ncbi:hypothetical protein E1162_09035 [Rhodobacteraceae bacterium RKSG542]|uniref:DUF6163 family protein n=1 Tax=Pseudovibrio flavus TaxID=2529854 RepID=UPI0012BBABD1|nr:DUF6163 family protein [Pseudovibrio flavus]MTI17385.1 hypothetical protein [Pseudovibrio flavus]